MHEVGKTGGGSKLQVVLLHDLTSVLLGIEESYGPTVCDSDGKDGYSSCR